LFIEVKINKIVNYMKRAFFAIIALAVVGCSGAEKEKKTNEFL
jgi:hypothetical protein